jgi:hypothetical protein
MTYTPLSDILVSAAILECTVNAVFVTLSESQQIAVFNAAQQRVNDSYATVEKSNYLSDTLATAGEV